MIDVPLLLESRVLPHIGTMETPALVYLDEVLLANLAEYREFSRALGLRLLYSVKSCSFDFLIQGLAHDLAGYDVSSLAEAQLVRELEPQVELHFTSPNLSERNFPTISALCKAINMNSLSQLARFGGRAPSEVLLGLRVNPGFSAAKDPRYDPARSGSKLGVPARHFGDWLETGTGLDQVAGLHFHLLCESSDFAPVVRTLQWLEDAALRRLRRLQYLNIGGGWLRPAVMAGREELQSTVERLRERGSIELYTEPGNGIAREAGVLLTRVIDLFEVDGPPVAVVDATVSHVPEVYEYAWSPDVCTPGGLLEQGGYEYQVADCSCLAGDLFGRYCFAAPLELGQPLFFCGLGAYAWAKAAPFNGLLLPTVYRVKCEGDLVCVRPPRLDDYRQHWITHGAN